MILDIADFAANAITAAQLSVTAQGTDELTLTVASSVNADDLLGPFEQLVLKDGLVTRFVGWRDRAPRMASGTAQSRAYILTGPMRWLDRTPWTNTLQGGLAQLSQVSGNDIAPIDTSIRAILDFVRAATNNAIAYVDADLDIAVLQTGIAPETRVDSKCGDLLRRALKFIPTVVYWWEYPTIMVGGVATIIPTIRFADADKLIPDMTLSESLYQLSQVAPDPRYDLLFNKVQIYWLSGGTISLPEEAIATAGDAFDLVSANAAAARTFVQSFECGWYNIPTGGLAAALLKFYSRLHVDCSPAMVGLDWSHRPGQLWSYASLLASPYKSFCHQITRDLFLKTQTLALGVPPAFSAYSLSEGNNAHPTPKTKPGGGHPFQGVDASDPGISGNKVRTVYGTISCEAPDGFALGDDPAFIMDATGSQIVYVIVTIDATTGAITSRTISQAGTIPADDGTTFHYQLYSYTVDAGRLIIAQAVAGSLNFQVCPLNYSNPRTWAVIWGPA